MKNKYRKSTKPGSKQTAVVYSRIDGEMKKALKEYIDGSLSDEQINQVTHNVQTSLSRLNIKIQTLIQLIKENGMINECVQEYGVKKINELTYKQLLAFCRKNELELVDYSLKEKSPYTMTRKELENCIRYSKYYDMFLSVYNVIDLKTASIEELRKFALEHNLSIITQGKTKKETKKLKEIRVLLNGVKENDMIQELIEKYELSLVSNVSISQLEEFCVLISLVSKETFCSLIGIEEDKFYEYRERLEKIDFIRSQKSLKKCLAMYGESSVSALSIDQINAYIELLNRN